MGSSVRTRSRSTRDGGRRHGTGAAGLPPSSVAGSRLYSANALVLMDLENLEGMG